MDAPRIGRLRVELRLSPTVVALADEMAEALGLRRNAFFAMAIARLSAQLALVYFRSPRAERGRYLAEVEKMLEASLDEIRNIA